MIHVLKLSLRWMSAIVALLLFFPVSAPAQIDCGECGAWNSCGESCTYCMIPSPDGYCGMWDLVYTTCGESGGACLRDDCTSNWQEVSVEVQGTYGTTRGIWPNVYCEHHRVEWVTMEDLNHCNTDPYYWTQSYCQNIKDGVKFGTSSVDCCDGTTGTGELDPTFTCNHFHQCTGS